MWKSHIRYWAALCTWQPFVMPWVFDKSKRLRFRWLQFVPPYLFPSNVLFMRLLLLSDRLLHQEIQLESQDSLQINQPITNNNEIWTIDTVFASFWWWYLTYINIDFVYAFFSCGMALLMLVECSFSCDACFYTIFLLM